MSGCLCLIRCVMFGVQAASFGGQKNAIVFSARHHMVLQLGSDSAPACWAMITAERGRREERCWEPLLSEVVRAFPMGIRISTRLCTNWPLSIADWGRCEERCWCIRGPSGAKWSVHERIGQWLAPHERIGWCTKQPLQSELFWCTSDLVGAVGDFPMDAQVGALGNPS